MVVILQRLVPAQIETASDWATVHAGANFAFAVKTTGTLWSFGDNTAGKLGLGAAATGESFAQVTGTGWAEVATSSSAAHSFGRKL